MKKLKALSIVLAVALVVSTISVSPAGAKEKPYKPVLSKKKVTVETGSTVKIRLKNAKKVKIAASSSATSSKPKYRYTKSGKRIYKYTVKWSINKKKVAKIVKKRSKGKKSYAIIKGITPGKATLKAKVYRFGKKIKKIKCKIKVVNPAPVQPTAPIQPTAPSATSTADVTPTQTPTDVIDVTATPGATRTPKPTATPSPVPTATPTHVPNTQPPVEKPWPEGAKNYDVNLKDTISTIGDSTWVVNNDGSITVTFAGTYPDVSFTVPEADRIPNYYKWVEIVYSDSDGNRGLSIYDKNINWDAPWESDATTKYDMGPEFLPEWAGDCVCIVPYSDLEDWNEFMTRLDIYAPTFDGGNSNGGKITIKSIKMYSDEVGATPTPTATPEVTATPEPSATPTPGATKITLDIDPSKVIVVGQDGATVTKGEDGSISYSNDAGFKGFMIPIPEGFTLANGESIKISMPYESTGCDARIYFLNGSVDVAKSNILGPSADNVSGIITATDNCNYIFVKAATYADSFKSLDIKSITLDKDLTEATATPGPTATPPVVYEKAGEIKLNEATMWDKLLNVITFGNYEAPEPAVSITSVIPNSSIYYYVVTDGSETALTESELKALPAETWKAYEGEIALTSSKNVVYAKITDTDTGNDYYLCTDGITKPAPTPVVIDPVEEVAPVNNYVFLHPSNVAITDPSTKYTYENGGVTVELSANYSGFGVAYYINTDKSTVDLSEYDSIVFNITSEGSENGDYPVVFSTKNNIQNDSYWGNGSTEANVRYNTIVTGTQDYTYTDWSGEAQAVFIKYNTYGSDRTDAAKFTVNSIKLVKNTDVCVYKAESLSSDATVMINSTTKYGDVSFNLNDALQYAEDYNTVLEFAENISGRTGGSVTKYLGTDGEDGDVTYTATGDKTGKLEVNLTESDVHRVADVTYETTDDYIRAVVKFPANTGIFTVYKSDPNTVHGERIKNGVTKSPYTLKFTRIAEGEYEVEGTTPAGNMFKATKRIDDYTVAITKSVVESKGITVEYLENE